MRRSWHRMTMNRLSLFLAPLLAVAAGCSQGSVAMSQNAPPQAKAVEEQATRSQLQVAAQTAQPKPGAAAAAAKQTTGELGTPSATSAIPGKQIPPPDPKFGGVIKEKASDSKPWWSPRIVPPKGAPNVLLIMTDDCGFGSPSTFGGVIPTPALDRIAQTGLRYTQFHSTSLCSPTRAALITGRNHHVSGFGVVGEAATGYPGYDSVIRRECGTIGEILKQNGYATSWFGKDHNTPFYQASVAGPFDQWPNGLGFEYFYGFVGGDTSQWTPNLFRNTTPIYPFDGKPDWNLTTAMADEAIAHVKGLHEVAPDKPFFVYYVPGGVHAPHHPTKKWIKKISDMHLFDDGWNKLRDSIFANQKRLGLIPQDTKLTSWPKELPEWDTLNFEEKKLFIKQADVFAAYLAYTDHEIGRVIQTVEDMGELDNTLIIYISGDNGASPEGTVNGTPNEFTFFNGVTVPVKDQFLLYEFWGSDETFPHYSAGWAWAFDTPFQWCKQVASHFGGTRQGMCMSWPGHINDVGGIRTQFHHMIDIVPTILESAGIPAPDTINGIQQRPIDGVSMAYTWDKANAAVPSKRTTQYFEMLGNRAIYHDGWVACTTPVNTPWDLGIKPSPDVIAGYKWELYHTDKDFSQANDLAAKEPEKLKKMQELFYVEAKKHDVLPLDNSTLARFLTPRPSPTAGRTTFNYSGELSGVPPACAPSILGRSYNIEAEVEIPEGGAEGMIVTEGGRFGGYGLFLNKGELDIGRGKVVFLYNLLGKRIAWEGPKLEVGKHKIVFDFKYDGPGFGKGGTGTLSVDGKEVAKKTLEHTVPITFPEDETFDVGMDTRTPVSLIEYHYACPFKFTGKIARLTYTLGPHEFVAEKKEQGINRPGVTGQFMNKPLFIAALAEAATGMALIVVPSVVARLLLGMELSGVAVALGRVAGCALLSLGIACWPGKEPTCAALGGMITYGLLVTIYLLYLGIRGEWVGPLLWPAVVFHGVLSLLLARTWFDGARRSH